MNDQLRCEQNRYEKSSMYSHATDERFTKRKARFNIVSQFTYQRNRAQWKNSKFTAELMGETASWAQKVLILSLHY